MVIISTQRTNVVDNLKWQWCILLQVSYFPHKVATRPCWRCANVLKQRQVESGSESKLELVPKHLRLPLNGDAGGGFRGWKKVICFTSGLILLQRSSSRLLAKSIKIILDIFFGRHQQLFQQFLKTIFARCWKWHLKVRRHTSSAWI